VEKKGAFELGKAQVLSGGADVAIIACGIMVHEALAASRKLLERGIKVGVINVHTIKPLDTETIIDAARSAGKIVVCEEHAVVGGLASSIDEAVAEHCPARIVRIGIRHRFGQSGEPADLLKEYRLTCADIEQAALSLLSK